MASAFAAPVVTEATRGCPFSCSYCALTIRPAPYRVRPVTDVIRDVSATSGLPFHKRKLAMLYDNNLAGDMRYALTFTGTMLALDGDTPEYYESLPASLEEVDPSALSLSISIPIPGTPLHRQIETEGRITDYDLSHYEEV